MAWFRTSFGTTAVDPKSEHDEYRCSTVVCYSRLYTLRGEIKLLLSECKVCTCTLKYTV